MSVNREGRRVQAEDERDEADSMTAPERITRAWLDRHRACEDGWVAIFEERWPEGAPVTLKTAYAALRYGVRPLDVLWVAVRLLPDRRARRDFIVFTLRQRQPYIVKRLHLAGFPGQARAIRAIDWTDLSEARQVLLANADIAAALAAASGALAAATYERAARKIYRAQLRWIAERIGAAG